MISTKIKALAVLGTLTGAVLFDALVLRADEDTMTFQGFGAETTGGVAGEVITVTSLDNDGPGTLRWALEKHHTPRTIAFDVSGTIALDHQIEIRGGVTIDGSTAPGAVTITGGRLRVIGDNVIITGLRIRPGDGTGQPFESRDGISIGKSGASIENVVIDSNSISYGIDENLSIFGDVKNVTISNNIIANALDESLHPKGPHSMGMLIANGATRVTVVDNLLANNANRNPTINDASEVEVINNLVYNWSENGLHTNNAQVHAIGNVYSAGPDTVVPDAFVLKSADGSSGAYYLSDNVATVKRGEAIVDEPLFAGSGIIPRPSDDVTAHVLQNAGARLPELDAIDQAIIAGVRHGTGVIINTPSDLYDQTAAMTEPARAN